MKSKTKYTLLKTASYASMHMIVAIAVAYTLSGSWKVAFAIGLIEPAIQTFAFFFHEKAWHNFEHHHGALDHHNEVIDSVSPVTSIVEDHLNDKPQG